jgi:hypothetical protein
MLAEQQDQASKLEVELAARRKKRQLEAEKRRREREEEENAKANEQESILKEKMDGIRQLIKPVQNEDKRLEALMQDPAARADLMGRAIIRPGTPEELKQDTPLHKEI